MGWDEETDVIAVGLGAAGAATAIAASDAGAEVVIIEKQPRAGHAPSTRMSGGIVMTVSDVASAVPYLDACAGGMVPIDVTTAWAEQASTLLDWLTSLEPSVDWAHVGHGEFPDLAGGDSVDAYRTGSGRATGRTSPAARWPALRTAPPAGGATRSSPGPLGCACSTTTPGRRGDDHRRRVLRRDPGTRAAGGGTDLRWRRVRRAHETRLPPRLPDALLRQPGQHGRRRPDGPVGRCLAGT